MKTRAIGFSVITVVTTFWVGAQALAQLPSPTPRPLRVQLRFCGDDPGELASVASVRAAAAGQCPCGGFAKHTDYVRCVRSVAKAAVKSGALRKVCYLAAMRDAARSTCGRAAGAVTCCRVSAKEKRSCGISRSAERCRPVRGGTATAGNSESCYDACLPSLADVTLTDPQIQAAAATALDGIVDASWVNLALLVSRAFAELGVRLDEPTQTPTPQVPGPLQSVQVASETRDCLNTYCSDARYCGGASNSVNAPLGGSAGAYLLTNVYWYPPVGPCLNNACFLHDLRSFKSCIYGSSDAWGRPTGNPDCYFSPQSAGPSLDGGIQSIDGALFDSFSTCPDQDGVFASVDKLVHNIATLLDARPWCSDCPSCSVCKDDLCRTAACGGASCNSTTSMCACDINGCSTLRDFRCLDASPGSIEQQCLMGATGCLAWSVGQECANGCMNNQCAPPPCVTNGCATFQATQCLNSTTQQTCGDSGAGCLSWGADVPCDDGNACTVGDTCAGGVCQLGTAATCNNNGIRECSEQCDGTDDVACPGLCQSDCSCGVPAAASATPTPSPTPTVTPAETTPLASNLGGDHCSGTTENFGSTTPNMSIASVLTASSTGDAVSVQLRIHPWNGVQQGSAGVTLEIVPYGGSLTNVRGGPPLASASNSAFQLLADDASNVDTTFSLEPAAHLVAGISYALIVHYNTAENLNIGTPHYAVTLYDDSNGPCNPNGPGRSLGTSNFPANELWGSGLSTRTMRYLVSAGPLLPTPMPTATPGLGTICSTAPENGTAILTCPSGAITAIDFASYGTPDGTCGAFTLGACNAGNSLGIVTGACVGRTICAVAASNATFNDPCPGTAKRLYVQAQCGSGLVATPTPTLTALPAVDQSQTSADTSIDWSWNRTGPYIFDWRGIAQTFIPFATTLSAISVRICRNGSLAAYSGIDVHICTGLPCGLGGSSDITGSTLSGVEADNLVPACGFPVEVRFEFPTVTVTPGSTYSWSMGRTNFNGGNLLRSDYESTGDSYSGGVLYYQDDNGADKPMTGADWWFKTWL